MYTVSADLCSHIIYTEYEDYYPVANTYLFINDTHKTDVCFDVILINDNIEEETEEFTVLLNTPVRESTEPQLATLNTKSVQIMITNNGKETNNCIIMTFI